MQRYPQPVYPWPPPPGYPPVQQPYPAQRLGLAPPSQKRAARVQQARTLPFRPQCDACDQCRMRKRRCDAMQPCDHCVREGHECLYTRSPNLKDDKLVNLINSVAEKLEHVLETVRRVDRAHRTTQQYLFNESREQNPALNEHRTPAHNLILLWPSIRAVLDGAGVNVREDYVAKAEDRPLLDPFALRSSAGIASTSPLARPYKSRSRRTGSLPRTQPQSRSHSSEPSLSRAGGLKSDGSLDLDRETLESLLASYLVNIHVLHPFLPKHRLRHMFDSFVHRFSGRPSMVDSAADANTFFAHPRKRKRSVNEGSMGSYDDESVSFAVSQRERMEFAIVWLVLALGKICQHKRPLPEVFDGAPDVERMFSSQHTSGGEQSREISSSPFKSASASNLAEWAESFDGYTPSQHSTDAASDDFRGHLPMFPERNLDAVPGLAHYTKATEVLGTQVDGNTLAHAQMFLLAGLYKGQLARVRESMSWIAKAGQVVRLLLEAEGLHGTSHVSLTSDVRKLSTTRNKDTYQDSIYLTAWTCLQLESDILAELKFPSSGIPALELMPYDIPDCGIDPRGRNEADDAAFSHDNVVLFYSAQSFLRTKLNQVHREIYGNLDADHAPPQIQEMLRGHDLILTEWRTKLPAGLRWEDSDPPPSNILHARLRAKYWGARYIITRPFLDYVMHIMPYIKSARDVDSIAKDARGDARDPAEVRLLEAICGMPQSEVWRAAEACVEAAMHSTVAFDGIPDRLVVTNIHGTAHAQFGNMLVLAATYNDEKLKAYVPEEKLRYLLDRTITFLDRLAAISQTCKADCWILQRIRRWLFTARDISTAVEEADVPTRPASGSSFGSTIAVAPGQDTRQSESQEHVWRSRLASADNVPSMVPRSYAAVCSDTR